MFITHGEVCNMCANFAASARTRLVTRVVWQDNFSQRLMVLAMKDVSDSCYERL